MKKKVLAITAVAILAQGTIGVEAKAASVIEGEKTNVKEPEATAVSGRVVNEQGEALTALTATGTSRLLCFFFCVVTSTSPRAWLFSVITTFRSLLSASLVVVLYPMYENVSLSPLLAFTVNSPLMSV